MFMSALFKSFFPSLFDVKIFKTLEFNFGISFVCNGPDLNELLPKIWSLGSTATLQLAVWKLAKIT